MNVFGDHSFNMYGHSVTPPPPNRSAWGGGVNLLPNFQKGGGFTRPQFLEGVAGKEGGDLFPRGGGCSFYIKNKVKDKIFKDKRR